MISSGNGSDATTNGGFSAFLLRKREEFAVAQEATASTAIRLARKEIADGGDDESELSAELFSFEGDMGGPGTELKSILTTLLIKSDGCGGCTSHAKTMDEKGIKWCEDNVETIVGWMRNEAQQRKWWMYSDIVARQLIYRAISRAREAEVSEVSEPFELPGTRHLLYHLGPFAKNSTWRRNVEQLMRRIWLFNGKRVVAIVTGHDMVDPDEVKEAFSGNDIEFFCVPNNPKLREVSTFVPLLDEVKDYQSDITFYAHAKGVTRAANAGETCHRWASMLYELNLDYFPIASELLQRYPMAGAFKKVGHGFKQSKSTWHYSGTYYWFRNRDVFARQWRNIDLQWYGTEAWPGIMFLQDEAGCIFHEGHVPGLDMYRMSYLNDIVEPKLRAWRASHSHHLLRWKNAVLYETRA